MRNPPTTRFLAPVLLFALAGCSDAAPVPPPAGADAAGDPLPAWAVARIGTARFAGPCPGCAFSADGKSVIAACNDGFVRTFDAATGRETASFAAHRDVVKPRKSNALSRLGDVFHDPGPPPDGIHHAAFSSDGTRLVTCGGPALRLWDVAKGTMLAELVRSGPPERIAFSPDGKLVRVADIDGLGSWDPATGSFAATPVRAAMMGFLGMHGTRDAVVVRPRGGGNPPTGAVLVDVGTGAATTLAVPGVATGCGTSPDGRSLAILSTTYGKERTHTLSVCDASSGEVRTSVPLDAECWGTVAWSRDGAVLALCSSLEVALLDAQTLVRRASIPLLGPRGVKFSPDGARLLVHTFFGPRVFDAATLEEIPPGLVRVAGYSLRWTGDGKRLSAFEEHRTVGVFDAASGARVGGAGPMEQLAGAYVLADDGGVTLLPKDAVPSDVADAPFNALLGVARADGTRVLAFRWKDGTVAVRDLGTGREVRRPSAQAVHCSLSPTGRRLATITKSGTIVLTDVDRDADVATFSHPDNLGFAGALAVADTPRVAAVSVRQVFVFDPSATDPVAEFKIDARWDATCVALSRDGRLVAAVVGWDVVVWEVDSGDEVVRLSGSRAPPSDLEFSPDGTRLVAASGDGTGLVYALPQAPR